MIKVSIGYIEIYNEQINDLLDPLNKNIKIMENQDKSIYIDKLTKIEIDDEDEMHLYLD